MWRVDFFFKISKRDFTFIREMKVGSGRSTGDPLSNQNACKVAKILELRKCTQIITSQNPVNHTRTYDDATTQNLDSSFRVRPRFFDQVGHQTMYASSGNKYFSLNHVIARLTKIMNNLLEHLKTPTFKDIILL